MPIGTHMPTSHDGCLAFGRNLELSRIVKNGGIITESMPAVKLSGSIMQNIAD